MNRRRCIGLLLTVAILAVVAWTAHTQIAIWYHKQCLAYAEQRCKVINAEQMAGTASDNGRTSYWYAHRVKHCERLVALGYFFHDSYQFDNLPPGVHQQLYVRLLGTFPTGYYSMRTSNADYVIDVYDLPESKPKWDSFVVDHNVPDFVGRYVDGTNTDAESGKDGHR